VINDKSGGYFIALKNCNIDVKYGLLNNVPAGGGGRSSGFMFPNFPGILIAKKSVKRKIPIF